MQVKLAHSLKLRLRSEGACLSDSVTGTGCVDAHLSKATCPLLPPSTQETAACLPLFDFGFACC